MSIQDVKTIYDAIQAKKSRLTHLIGYYEGDQPTVYLTQRLREVFRGVDLAFTENWCSVVVDACKDRISLSGFHVKDAHVQALLDAVWGENEMGIEADDVHETALVCGESYLIVWPNEESGEPEAYFNDPRMVEIVYDPGNPRCKLFAGKLWTAADDTARMTLYYCDHLEYYATTQKIADVSAASAFQPLLAEGENWPVNEYGCVPVFCFKPNRSKLSDLKNVIPIQNGINKLLADMIVAAEYGAFRQRWVISAAQMEGKVSSQPGEMLQLPPGDGQEQDTAVGEFDVTDLDNYLKAIDNLSTAIGKVTGTPRHYFFSQGGDPSGEALIAMEAPLNKKAQGRIDRFTVVWQEVAAFIAQIGGLSIKKMDVTPVFDEPETIQPKTQAEIIKLQTDAGIPLVTVLRQAGWSDSEIEQMQKDQKADKAAGTSMAQAILEQQRVKNEQQNPPAAPMPMVNQTMPMMQGVK
jgi:hypothetical protein